VTVSISIAGADDLQATMRKYLSLTGEQVAAKSYAVVQKTIRDNFAAYGKEKQNKFKAQSTGYWKRAAEATFASSSGSMITAEVFEGKTSLRGVRRHYAGGGTIRPKNTNEVTGRAIKFLTIPARAEAHGKTVGTLRATGVNLYRAGGTLREQTGAKRSPNDPVYFYLAKQVGPMQPNPRILPTDAQFMQAITETVEDILATPNG
jgi:hypothetical protein